MNPNSKGLASGPEGRSQCRVSSSPESDNIKGVPGRFKRILLAWASFANNDGTNIFPSKETVGDRAGIEPLDGLRKRHILEAADVLQRAGSHVCRTGRCNKGGTHWTSRHGQYTAVYKINVVLLGNPTVLLRKIKEATVAKSNSGTVSEKTQPGTVVKPDTTRALEETPAPLGIEQDSSVLTDGLVSSLASSDDSLRSSSTSMAAPSLRSEKKNQSQGPLAESRDTPTAFTVDGQLSEADGTAQENDDETEEDKAETDAYWQIAGEADIAKLLGVPCFDEKHDKALSRMAKVLVSRNRSALWLFYMVKWMKEHKAFWAKRLHAGDRAINQLAKHMESGACCGSSSTPSSRSRTLTRWNPASTSTNFYSKIRCARNLNMTRGLNRRAEPGGILENGTLLRPVGGGFDLEEI